MPVIMQCPFFKKQEGLKLKCEGGNLMFPDAAAKREYIIGFCANNVHWTKCSICRNLENYYERKEEKNEHAKRD